MMVLTRAAERAIAAATRARDVPALRVLRPDGPAASSPPDEDADHPADDVVVATEPAQGPGPGETAVRRGAATVYVPGILTGRFDQAVLDLHRHDADGTLRLVLRGSTPSGVPGTGR